MSKYRLEITGLEQMQLGGRAITRKIDAWVEGTGAKNVTSGEFRMNQELDRDYTVFTTHFNSSAWTGRN